MKNRKNLMIIVAVLLIAAALGVGMYVRNSQMAGEVAGAITLRFEGKDIPVTIASLDRVDFEGETVNGKGEHFSHSYRGVELKTLLEEKNIDVSGVTGIKAVSADQFEAEYTGDEMRESGHLYLAVQMDGKALEGIDKGTQGVQVIVFGDENSRRLVRSLSVVEIQ
jgi:hypothetical protein